MFVVVTLVVAGSVCALIIVLAVRAAAARVPLHRSKYGPSELEALGRALGVPAESPFLIERHGRSFTASENRESKFGVTRISVDVDEIADAASAGAYRGAGREHQDLRPALILRNETSWDRLGKRLGLNRKVETGDAAFDAAFAVETDAVDEDVKRTLAGESVREGVRQLLASDVRRVELDPTGLSAVLLGPTPKAEVFEHVITLLAQIAAGLPLFKVGRASQPRAPIPPAGLFGCGAVILLASILIIGTRPPIESHAKLVGIGSGLVLWGLVTVVSALLIRGRSSSLQRIAMITLGALLAVPVGTWAAVYTANCWLDTSPTIEHATTITRAWLGGKGAHYVTVAPWRPGQEAVDLYVSDTFFRAAAAGRGIGVTTHAGWLGLEWVDTFRLLPTVRTTDAP